MANINEIISEVEKFNPELARKLKKYVKDHSYGLVFEHNLPEAVRLYTKTPAVGDTVNILSERGKKEKNENTIPWVVKYIDGDEAVIEHDGETKKVSVGDIVTIVSYRDVIYPGLKEIDRIERGNPDDPYHMVINSENYHALEALAYCYSGKVDCIYIDPPYNTGAKDWKYNNDYVDENDQYRHSKWLAFMERRLKLAKQLLNSKDSVLIVTIDEKEYLRLGLLLDQIFPEARIQMVTSMISRKGSVRHGNFTRKCEYIYFVMLGSASPVLSDVDMATGELGKQKQCWRGLTREGASGLRTRLPSMFYPIFFSKEDGSYVGCGESPQLGVDRESVPVPDGCFAVWPALSIRDQEQGWRLSQEGFNERLAKGFVRFGPWKKGQTTRQISYAFRNVIESVESGIIKVVGHDENGAVQLAPVRVKLAPPDMFGMPSHDASPNGTNLLHSIMPLRSFPFPKSLYAVYDCIRLFSENNPNALIVDFFAGSGTTLHAVNLLNAEDGGHRRCICVTNNEVSADEEKEFTAAGFRQGDPEWEKHGIAHYVTWPRTKCTIEGVDITGKPLQGDYGCEVEQYDEMEGDVTDPETGKKIRGKVYKKVKRPAYPELAQLKKADGFKANAIFCELTYESAWPIRLDRAFDAIAPILWMQAGCRGPIIRRIGKSYLTTDYYGVLFDYNQASKFCDKVKRTPTIKTVYVVTDDQRRYSNMCKRLPNIEVHRLYETYLRTFEICGEGGLD